MTSQAQNIVLIVVDDLRPDLSCLGYPRETTPFLDSMASSAFVYRKCFALTGWTLPSVATILTGLDPRDHGLVDHNHRHHKPKIGHYLGDDYHRIGIANNGNMVSDHISDEYLEKIGHKRRPVKWKRFGWDDGFDEYHWTHLEDHETPIIRAKRFLSTQQDDNSGKPYFLFFHTNIVHDYNFNRPYYLDVEDWVGDLHDDLVGFRDGPNIWRAPPEGLTRDKLQAQIKAKYDAGVRYFDRRLSEIFELIDFSNTIVLLVGDHGEGFSPAHGRVHHCGRLHNDLIHVPLFLWTPPALGCAPAPRSDFDRVCSTLDVAPTLLNRVGRAQENLPGTDLLKLPIHTEVSGHDAGYMFWDGALERDNYDDHDLETTCSLTYPLKSIKARKNDQRREFVYHLANDPDELENLADVEASRAYAREPISFICAVNDFDELEKNLLASPIRESDLHEWIIVDNVDNKAGENIAEIYADAMARTAHDLVFFFHQDVYLPHGWERDVFARLAELDKIDPDWGVVGAAGVAANELTRRELVGHWCDPHKYWMNGALPQEVEALDELWLGIRKSSGVSFDRQLPGFHCYGIDLCLTAAALGQKSYAIDAFLWHKFRDSAGRFIRNKQASQKIKDRDTEKIQQELDRCRDFIREKWRDRLPFRSTSFEWRTS